MALVSSSSVNGEQRPVWAPSVGAATEFGACESSSRVSVDLPRPHLAGDIGVLGDERVCLLLGCYQMPFADLHRRALPMVVVHRPLPLLKQLGVSTHAGWPVQLGSDEVMELRRPRFLRR